MDSSSASSPISSRSTIASSPEATTSGGEVSTSGPGKNRYPSMVGVQTERMVQGMDAAGSYSSQEFIQSRTSPSIPDVQLEYPLPRSYASSRPSTTQVAPPAAPPVNGTSQHGGTRSEPPKRLVEVEGVPIGSIPLDQIAVATPLGMLSNHADMMRSKLLLQGDPQYIHKQRVETAIRVILDLLLQTPPYPQLPPVHPSLSNLLHDDLGNIYSLQRIGALHALRLQAGTTTKSRSKKQIQAGPPPTEHLAYLETAVHMSGMSNDGRRVYACKRCRMREARRKEHKDATRKKLSNSGSDSSNPTPLDPYAQPPSQDWVTGLNPDQYDPHRVSQKVEEPPWNPMRPDWRHEIVSFNSTPEVAIKDGSCVWLPFRVVCYGKCHGEKTGFRIRFTLRTPDGRVIATAETNPIKITDDHKTDKVKLSGEGTATAAVPRSRRGRASATSSRRQSPARSDGESVRSLSEAGAVLQKQTQHVRSGKPYDRPAPQNTNGASPMEGFSGSTALELPHYRRQHSASSVHSVPSMSAISSRGEMADTVPGAGSVDYAIYEQPRVQGVINPGALRRSQFNGFTAMDGKSSYPSSAAQSRTSSNVASPTSQYLALGHDDLMSGHQLRSPTDLIRALNVASLTDITRQQPQSSQAPMVSGFRSDQTDMDIDNILDPNLDHLYDRSGHASLASSVTDEVSAFSTGFSNRFPEGSLFSESGLMPESDDMTNFLDFSGGQDQALNQPSIFYGSPFVGGQEQILDQSSFSSGSGNDFRTTNGFLPRESTERNPHAPRMLPPMFRPSPAAFRPSSPHSVPNVPTITTVIPAEGPVAGGTTVAIIGEHFSHENIVLFGGRPAKLERVSPVVIQCLSPAAVAAGVVEVTIQEVPTTGGASPNYFKYNEMNADLMRLALQVRDHYQAFSGDPMHRAADHVSGSASDLSEQSNHRPSNSNSVPQNASAPMQDAKEDTQVVSSAKKPTQATPNDDLQMTIIAFLASIDESAPGSLRRSGAINTRNDASQTMLHVATVMDFRRLVRRLIVIGAHLDLQDVNGYTALGLASLCGRSTSARVLIEAGASYDRPTAFGEMPLDLAKAGDNRDVEALLLSAVWSTEPTAPIESATSQTVETGSEIDNENPSSGSDDEVRRILRRRKSRKARGKQKMPTSSPRRSRRPSLTATTCLLPKIPTTADDDPPPYDAPVDPTSWMSRTLSNLPYPPDICPVAVRDRFPMSIFGPDETADYGWVAFPAPSWETLQKMARPEEVKLFTQAMAAAAFNAVVQSGATTTSSSPLRPSRSLYDAANGSRKSRNGHRVKRSKSESPAGKVVRHVKHDRMLYLFWLPILLFVGFWLCVTALPLATGFCLIYARQITRAIKQRI